VAIAFSIIFNYFVKDRMSNTKRECTKKLPEKLQNDQEFVVEHVVAQCFRNRSLWRKLNEEEKNFCKKAKNKRKAEKRKQKSDKSEENAKTAKIEIDQ
jgi:23S rRNA maturation mini-RNase III